LWQSCDALLGKKKGITEDFMLALNMGVQIFRQLSRLSDGEYLELVLDKTD